MHLLISAHTVLITRCRNKKQQRIPPGTAKAPKNSPVAAWGCLRSGIPSGKHTKKLWKITIFYGKTHYKLPFSIAFCMFTRGYLSNSMDWLKGKSKGNHRFSHEIWVFPVIFPLNQSID